jgi:aryl-alcohol dehydrogenase-like predicted oxidoreductase
MLRQRDNLLEEVGVNPDNLTHWAIRFCLSHPAVASMIVSLNTRDQVRDVLSALEGDRLSADLARRLHVAKHRVGQANSGAASKS